MFFKIHLTLHINVQSGQLYMRVVQLDRKINCRFFTLEYTWYKKFWKKYESNLLHVRFACDQTFLLTGALWWKKSVKVLFWFDDGILYSRGAVIKRTIYVLHFYDFAEKKKNASTCKPNMPRRLDSYFFCRTFCTKYIQEWKTYSWFSYPMVPWRSGQMVPLIKNIFQSNTNYLDNYRI
jgi:hypothetical protein